MQWAMSVFAALKILSSKSAYKTLGEQCRPCLAHAFTVVWNTLAYDATWFFVLPLIRTKTRQIFVWPHPHCFSVWSAFLLGRTVAFFRSRACPALLAVTSLEFFALSLGRWPARFHSWSSTPFPWVQSTYLY